MKYVQLNEDVPHIFPMFRKKGIIVEALTGYYSKKAFDIIQNIFKSRNVVTFVKGASEDFEMTFVPVNWDNCDPLLFKKSDNAVNFYCYPNRLGEITVRMEMFIGGWPPEQCSIFMAAYIANICQTNPKLTNVDVNSSEVGMILRSFLNDFKQPDNELVGTPFNPFKMTMYDELVKKFNDEMHTSVYGDSSYAKYRNETFNKILELIGDDENI